MQREVEHRRGGEGEQREDEQGGRIEDAGLGVREEGRARRLEGVPDQRGSAIEALSEQPAPSEEVVEVVPGDMDLTEQEGVIVLPGSSMGEGGEGFFRIALTTSEARLREAAARLGRLLA